MTGTAMAAIAAAMVLSVIVIFPDIYIFRKYLRALKSGLPGIVHWIPTTALIAGLSFLAIPGLSGGTRVFILKSAFAIVLCICIPKLLFCIFSLTGVVLDRIRPGKAEKACDRAGIAAGLVAAAAFVFGFTAGWQILTVNRITVESADIPEGFSGYRIVQLSDLHLGTYGGNKGFVRKTVEAVNSAAPDAVFFTGDIVNSHPDEIRPFTGILGRIRSEDGVFSILGNHDCCTYGTHDKDTASKWMMEIIGTEKSMGWIPMDGKDTVITRNGDSLRICGTADGSRLYTIYLRHNPAQWRDSILPQASGSLTLSGHTHALQFKIGRFSPCSWLYREWDGLYRERDGNMLYVSTGTGGTLPFRLGAWPAIDIITLVRVQE